MEGHEVYADYYENWAPVSDEMIKWRLGWSEFAVGEYELEGKDYNSIKF